METAQQLVEDALGNLKEQADKFWEYIKHKLVSYFSMFSGATVGQLVSIKYKLAGDFSITDGKMT